METNSENIRTIIDWIVSRKVTLETMAVGMESTAL